MAKKLLLGGAPDMLKTIEGLFRTQLSSVEWVEDTPTLAPPPPPSNDEDSPDDELKLEGDGSQDEQPKKSKKGKK